MEGKNTKVWGFRIKNKEDMRSRDHPGSECSTFSYWNSFIGVATLGLDRNIWIQLQKSGDLKLHVVNS